jgi:RNA polymerase sigma-70 factor (sigma-E family)
VGVGAARGSDEDFSAYVAARWMALVRTAYLLTGDFHEAEDLVQSTLAKVYPQWRRLREESVDAYVRRALVNNNRSRFRRRRVTQLLTPFLPGQSSSAGGRSDDWPGAGWTEGPEGRDDGLDREVLVAVLAQLPERQRAVVVLRYWEDLSAEEVADLLGCSVGTVKSQASRALAKLRESPALADYALLVLGAR